VRDARGGGRGARSGVMAGAGPAGRRQHGGGGGGSGG